MKELFMSWKLFRVHRIHGYPGGDLGPVFPNDGYEDFLLFEAKERSAKCAGR